MENKWGIQSLFILLLLFSFFSSLLSSSQLKEKEELLEKIKEKHERQEHKKEKVFEKEQEIPLFLAQKEDYLDDLGNFNWENVELKSDFHFPLFSNEKEWVQGQQKKLLIQKNIIEKEFRHKQSIGCALLKIQDWFKDAPPSFGKEIEPVLLFSEQHTGSSLLYWTVGDSTKSIASVHELFCCDKHCGGSKEEAILMYPKYLTALNAPQVGVKTALIGLQRHQFWDERQSAIDFPLKNNLKVIFLNRRNGLAHAFAHPGFHPGLNERLTFEPSEGKLNEIMHSAKQHEIYYRGTYCTLKRQNATVMITSYEELAGNFSDTMRKITTFMGAKGDGPWWTGGEGAEGPTRGTHTTLLDKLKNVDKVREYFKKKHPEKECWLDENCDWPPLDDCDSF